VEQAFGLLFFAVNRAPQWRGDFMSERHLSRSFYERSPIDVARDLLGKILVHGETSGRIVETEAYLGDGDDAAHSARGLTPRTRVIFGKPGHAYVYFIYGMYDCLNVVCEPEGIAGCVLIRALEPLTGIETMRKRRKAARRDEDLANGPGKLTRALGILIGHNGCDLTKGPILITEPPRGEKIDIVTTPRIGITKSADLPLRFLIQGNRYTSFHRPARVR
jgi:DNA-3-methyladenine glycosylase